MFVEARGKLGRDGGVYLARVADRVRAMIEISRLDSMLQIVGTVQDVPAYGG